MKHIWIILLLFQILGGQAWPQEDSTAVDSVRESCDCDDEQLDFFPSSVEQVLQERAAGGGRIEMDLFVMSLCPYGMEAERVLLPLVEKFKDQVGLDIHFIADEADSSAAPASAARRPASVQPRRVSCAAAATSGNGPFRSLHGQEEIDESQRQLIVLADHPERYRAYLLCRSRQGPGGDWRLCARAAGLDSDSLQQRALGPQGERLFRENIRLANALRIDLSPTLLIDGEEFSGDFDGFSLARLICRDRPDDESCRDIPVCGSDADCDAPPGRMALCEDADTPRARCVSYDPASFTLTVLQASACSICDTGEFLRTTAELFPGTQVETYDLGTTAGADLARKYGIQVFPAYIFGAGFAGSPRFSRVRHMVLPIGDSFVVQPRIASVTYWRQRSRQPGRLDLFLPARIVELEDEFLRLFSGEQVRVHHLLGGATPEAAFTEFARRACMMADQPRRYPAYAITRTLRNRQGGDGDWEEAAAAAGIDLDALQNCLDSGRGMRLLAAAQSLADSLDLRHESASALIENQILVRRARPAQVATIWQEGKIP